MGKNNVFVDIQLDEIGDLGDKIKCAIAKSQRQALQTIATTMLNASVKSFSDPSYRVDEWTPLSPETIKRKGHGKGILVDSGIMKNSLRKFIDQNGSMIGVSSSITHAQFHQSGTDNIPARPFVPVSRDKMNPRLLQDIQNEIDSIFNASFAVI